MNLKGYEVYDAEIEDVVCVGQTDDEAMDLRDEYIELWGLTEAQAQMVTIRGKR